MIKLPQTIEDCNLISLGKWLQFSKGIEQMDTFRDKLEFRVQVVSIFSGLTKKQLDDEHYRNVNQAFTHIIAMLSDYDMEDPVGVIEHEGKRYVYDKNIHNVSTAQVIDIKLIEDPYKSPYEIIATLYIEEGMSYNQEDEHGKVINPLDERVKVFKTLPIGREFLNMMGFFLRDYLILSHAMWANNLITMKITEKD